MPDVDYGRERTAHSTHVDTQHAVRRPEVWAWSQLRVPVTSPKCPPRQLAADESRHDDLTLRTKAVVPSALLPLHKVLPLRNQLPLHSLLPAVPSYLFCRTAAILAWNLGTLIPPLPRAITTILGIATIVHRQFTKITPLSSSSWPVQRSPWGTLDSGSIINLQSTPLSILPLRTTSSAQHRRNRID